MAEKADAIVDGWMDELDGRLAACGENVARSQFHERLANGDQVRAATIAIHALAGHEGVALSADLALTMMFVGKYIGNRTLVEECRAFAAGPAKDIAVILDEDRCSAPPSDDSAIEWCVAAFKEAGRFLEADSVDSAYSAGEPEVAYDFAGSYAVGCKLVVPKFFIRDIAEWNIKGYEYYSESDPTSLETLENCVRLWRMATAAENGRTISPPAPNKALDACWIGYHGDAVAHRAALTAADEAKNRLGSAATAADIRKAADEAALKALVEVTLAAGVTDAAGVGVNPPNGALHHFNILTDAPDSVAEADTDNNTDNNTDSNTDNVARLHEFRRLFENLTPEGILSALGGAQARKVGFAELMKVYSWLGTDENPNEEFAAEDRAVSAKNRETSLLVVGPRPRPDWATGQTYGFYTPQGVLTHLSFSADIYDTGLEGMFTDPGSGAVLLCHVGEGGQRGESASFRRFHGSVSPRRADIYRVPADIFTHHCHLPARRGHVCSFSVSRRSH